MKRKKYHKRIGLWICIPCAVVAGFALCLSLRNGASYPLYRIALGVLVFSLTFGLIVALHTNWKGD